MNILDIILLVVLAWAVYRGFRDGVIVQLGGIAGLFVGVYLAFRFGPRLGSWLGIGSDFSGIAGFIIVLVAVIILVALISRLLSKLFSAAGLGILNKLGGVLLALLKTGLILGLLLYCFDRLNQSEAWVKKERLDNSLFYRPLIGIAEHAFPYMDFVKDKLLELPGGGNGGEQTQQQ